MAYYYADALIYHNGDTGCRIEANGRIVIYTDTPTEPTAIIELTNSQHDFTLSSNLADGEFQWFVLVWDLAAENAIYKAYGSKNEDKPASLSIEALSESFGVHGNQTNGWFFLTFLKQSNESGTIKQDYSQYLNIEIDWIGDKEI